MHRWAKHKVDPNVVEFVAEDDELITQPLHVAAMKVRQWATHWVRPGGRDKAQRALQLVQHAVREQREDMEPLSVKWLEEAFKKTMDSTGLGAD